MDASRWLVAGMSLAAIAFVYAYFLGPRRARAARTEDGRQGIRIRVRGGYDPARIEVAAGRPVRLVFHREETEGCSDTVLLPEWKIVRKLPAHRDTAIEFTPERPGEYEFTCGMHMLRGTIVVK